MEQDKFLYAKDPCVNDLVLRPETWKSYVEAAGHVPDGNTARAIGSLEWWQRCGIIRHALDTVTPSGEVDARAV